MLATPGWATNDFTLEPQSSRFFRFQTPSDMEIATEDELLTSVSALYALSCSVSFRLYPQTHDVPWFQVAQALNSIFYK